ncbi:ARV1 [Arabidopsis thaliana]|uniref:Protein ARV n=1 Tax=Arabidopsis thaliana TaxID=3702 RepID=A0A178WKY9_ARATH|nr:ARV1 [Arabidopsis thaliana]
MAASEHRCVGCGFRVKSLFIQYSPGNIRLMKCGNCKEVADEYIECERMIIFIDLILHRPKVYRHVLYNAINPATVNIQVKNYFNSSS